MNNLTNELEELRHRFSAAVSAAADERALEDVRVSYLGRSGEVTLVRRTIGSLEPSQRPAAGPDPVGCAILERSCDQSLAGRFPRECFGRPGRGVGE